MIVLVILVSFLMPLGLLKFPCVSASPGHQYSNQQVETTGDSWRVPQLSVFDRLGNTVELRDLVKGKVAFIDIWATWCGPCIQAIPETRAFMKKFEGNEDVIFIFISIDSKAGAWKRKVEGRFGGQGIHVLSPGNWKSPAFRKFGLQGIPFIAVFDKSGNLVGPDIEIENFRPVEIKILEALALP